MNQTSKIRNFYALKNQVSNFLKKYKSILLSLVFIFLLGAIVGIFTTSKFSGNLELDNIPDSNLVNFITGDKGSFGVFFSYFLRYLLTFLFIVCLNFNAFFNILTYIIIAILGYIWGFTIAGIITLFSVAGIINVIIIFVPFDLCISFILIVITCVAIEKYKIYKKFGSNCSYALNYKKLYFFLFVLLVLILFIKCMIMPVIHITIIVN